MMTPAEIDALAERIENRLGTDTTRLTLSLADVCALLALAKSAAEKDEEIALLRDEIANLENQISVMDKAYTDLMRGG